MKMSTLALELKNLCQMASLNHMELMDLLHKPQVPDSKEKVSQTKLPSLKNID